MAVNEIVQRHEIADYLNIGTEDEPSYGLMGVGFTSLGETPNAQTTTKKYINEKSSTTNVNSYQPQFDFEADLIKDDDVVNYVYDVGRNEKTGGDCVTQYVRVDLWNATGTDNVYPARKFDVAVVVSGIDGEDDQVVSGSLNARGDFTDGYFNTSTKTFAESEEDAASETESTDTDTDTTDTEDSES